MMPVGRSGRCLSRAGQQLGLLEIARTRGLGAGGATTLPPGQRDASGFWFPAGYRTPMDLFTPRQRSLQAKQRALKPGRARRPPGQARSAGQVSPAAETAPLPLLITEVPAADSPAPGRAPLAHVAEPRAPRPAAASCVDSPGRSV
jgi:hypothetical protein